jgi:hypothetical protein
LQRLDDVFFIAAEVGRQQHNQHAEAKTRERNPYNHLLILESGPFINIEIRRLTIEYIECQVSVQNASAQ